MQVKVHPTGRATPAAGLQRGVKVLLQPQIQATNQTAGPQKRQLVIGQPLN